MMHAQDILIKYWGHTQFRPLQKEIINSVLQKQDTLALLPTGGGKSICFQVPALLQDGICLVISPLIALMKDQVDFLKSKGIKSVAITSLMTKNEIEIALNNCIYGGYKFLYISPERLQSQLLQNKIAQMQVNLIAVDEAHCISQWGYDFRPSYLHIKEIREIIPETPILALTATATNDTVKDIQKELLFQHENILQSSFIRENLAYKVAQTEDKIAKMISELQKNKGSTIVYVGTRKATKEIAYLLNKYGISADYYHAGLDIAIRNQIQESWMHGRKRVIVATNAFGMGIDKENVRLVIHFDTPNSLEAYFQEAGRAGRDKKPATALLISNKNDIFQIEQLLLAQLPNLEEIKIGYQRLADYLQIPINTAEGEAFNFNIQDFCEKNHFNHFKTYNILKFLETEEYIQLSDAVHLPSRLHIIVDHTELYRFQVAHAYYDHFIKLLLRSYSGLFENYVNISEETLAKRFNISTEQVISILDKLNALEIVNYVHRSNSPKIIFTRNRVETNFLNISAEKINARKELKEAKLKSMIAYLNNTTVCRTRQLLYYFGEKNDYSCGKCDVCESSKANFNDIDFCEIQEKIKHAIQEKSLNLSELNQLLFPTEEAKILFVLRWLIDNDLVEWKEDKYIWKN